MYPALTRPLTTQYPIPISHNPIPKPARSCYPYPI